MKYDAADDPARTIDLGHDDVAADGADPRAYDVRELLWVVVLARVIASIALDRDLSNLDMARSGMAADHIEYAVGFACREGRSRSLVQNWLGAGEPRRRNEDQA